MKRLNSKLAFTLAALTVLPMLFVNASVVPQREIQEIVKEAKDLDKSIDDETFSEPARKLIKSKKTALDNLIAAYAVAKDCEDLRQLDSSLRSGIYNLYPRGMDAGPAVTYCQVEGNRTKSEFMDALKNECVITQSSCPARPGTPYTGTFIDREADADWNKESCMKRAEDFHRWCKNEKSRATFNVYGRSVASVSAGDRSCSAPGNDIKHGKSAVFYRYSRGPCQAQIRKCDDGHLSGSYQYRSCFNYDFGGHR